MNNLRTSGITLNNYAKLDFLNEYYKIPRSPIRINKLTTNNKKSKIIFLEKSSPSHFPVYMKFVKKNGNQSKSPEKIVNSNKYLYFKKLNFQNAYKKNRNSSYSEINRNNNRMFNNLLDLNSSYYLQNENIINKLNNSLEIPKNGNSREKTINLRMISISPRNENSKRQINKKRNEIEVEENYNQNQNNNFENNFNKNSNKTDNKQRIRYLLSKNYQGKKFIKKKYLNKSPFSILSSLNRKNPKDLKKNLIIDINNNFNDNFDNNDSSRYYLIENIPQTLTNMSNTSIYKKYIPKINNKTILKKKQSRKNSPLIKIVSPDIEKSKYFKIVKGKEILSNRQDNNNIDNIFLYNKNYNNNELQINLNDLIFIEERLNGIIILLNNTYNIIDINILNESFEFFSFYFNSSLTNKFPLFFKIENRIIIKSAFNLNLLLILIIYHLSLNDSLLIKVVLFMRKIFEILKINLYLIIRKIEIYYGEEYSKKNEIYFTVFDYFLKNNNLYDLKEKEIIDIINKNCISMTEDIESILNYYQIINNKNYFDFRDIYLSISKIDEENIYDYFKTNFSNTNLQHDKSKTDIYINTDNSIEYNQDNQKLDSVILSYKKNKKIPPFIRLKTTKRYTLVLGLEDTIINVKTDNEGKIILCRPRPGLISFLNGIKPFYEIISFTKLSKEYSQTILKEIEGKKKLFDYNLYRDHCTLVGTTFIKDISRIGRDMKKIVMVDYLEDNLRFFVNNGILISPYNGKNDRNDSVLMELKKMLILFFRQGYDDIRNAIKNFKKEIYNKITLGNVV